MKPTKKETARGRMTMKNTDLCAKRERENALVESFESEHYFSLLLRVCRLIRVVDRWIWIRSSGVRLREMQFRARTERNSDELDQNEREGLMAKENLVRSVTEGGIGVDNVRSGFWRGRLDLRWLFLAKTVVFG